MASPMTLKDQMKLVKKWLLECKMVDDSGGKAYPENPCAVKMGIKLIQILKEMAQ